MYLFKTLFIYQFGCHHQVGALVPPRPDVAVSRSTVLIGGAQQPTVFQLQSCHLAQQRKKPLQHEGSWVVQASAESWPEAQLYNRSSRLKYVCVHQMVGLHHSQLCNSQQSPAVRGLAHQPEEKPFEMQEGTQDTCMRLSDMA